MNSPAWSKLQERLDRLQRERDARKQSYLMNYLRLQQMKRADENDELLTESEFKAKFQNSPVLRTKAKGLKRNIEAVRRNMNQQGNDSPPHQRKIEC